MRYLLNILYVSLCNLVGFNVAAQNLVPNPGFEEMHQCPQHISNFPVNYWFVPTISSPDSYSTCGINGTNIPQNAMGYRQPKTGKAYTGIILTNKEETREYLGVQLDQNLTAGKVYYWCMWVSRAKKSEWTSNNLGIAFSDKKIFQSSSLVLDLPVCDYWQLTITDSDNWTKVSGSFSAKGNERFLYIGNFLSNAETAFTFVYEEEYLETGAYCYIDDVYLGEFPCEGFYLSVPNVFSPNSDGVNDLFAIKGSEISEISMSIFNRWGQGIYSDNSLEGWDGKYNGETCDEGVYFYKLNFFNETSRQHEQRTGFFHLVK